MRLFVAAEIPEPVRDTIDRARDRLADMAPPSVRWVPSENLHLTLAFLGSVPPERVAEIAQGLRPSVGAVEPFRTRLEGSGAFPWPRRARVLWVGLEGEGLSRLASAVAAAMEALGFPAEARAWTPHVTVGRLRRPADVSGIVPFPVEAASFAVGEATLFLSHPRRPAPRYEPLERIPLGR